MGHKHILKKCRKCWSVKPVGEFWANGKRKGKTTRDP
jgi:hypothetical protein